MPGRPAPLLFKVLFVLGLMMPLAHSALALQERPVLVINIPTVQFTNIVRESADGSRYIDVPWIAEYATGVYSYGVGIAAALAGVMFVIGGFQYLTAGGDASRVSKAKERIKDAVVGLFLTFGAYTILITINPALTSWTGVRLTQVETKRFHADAPPTGGTVSEVPATATNSPGGGGTSAPPGTSGTPVGPAPTPVSGAATGNRCFTETFGANDAAVSARVRSITGFFGGRAMRFHELAIPDFTAAFQEIASAPADSPVGQWYAHVVARPVAARISGPHVARLDRSIENAAAAGVQPCHSCDLHKFGLAVDIDFGHNPSLRGARIQTDMPDELVALFARHRIYWGGYGWARGTTNPSNLWPHNNARDAIGYHDAMHFEWHGLCWNRPGH